MPRNTREWAKRKLGMSIGNIDTCGTHLEEVLQVYHEHHPEISEKIQDIQNILVAVQAAIELLDSTI